MRKLWIGAMILLAAETAALACSCIASDDPAELRRFAADAAQGAVALVEVETLSSYNPATGAGERMRVVKILAGTAPSQFQVERNGVPSGASCDVEHRVGERTQVILYPAQAASTTAARIYRTSGLCTVHLLDKPAFRDALMRSIADPAMAGERG